MGLAMRLLLEDLACAFGFHKWRRVELWPGFYAVRRVRCWEAPSDRSGAG